MREREARDMLLLREDTITHLWDLPLIQPSPPERAALTSDPGAAIDVELSQNTPAMSLRNKERDALPDGHPFFRFDNYTLLLVDALWTAAACAQLHAALRHLWQQHHVPRQNHGRMSPCHTWPTCSAVPQTRRSTRQDIQELSLSSAEAMRGRAPDLCALWRVRTPQARRREAFCTSQCLNCGEMGHMGETCCIYACTSAANAAATVLR